MSIVLKSSNEKHNFLFANLHFFLHNSFFKLFCIAMKDLFPYKGKKVTVTQDMCDFNGHMNVTFIKEVFEQGWEFTLKDFGFDESYLEQGYSSFTLEDNYRFKKEDIKFIKNVEKQEILQELDNFTGIINEDDNIDNKITYELKTHELQDKIETILFLVLLINELITNTLGVFI